MQQLACKSERACSYMSLVVEQSTWSQEWERAGPYMFACLSTCIDLEDGAKSFKLPHFEATLRDGTVIRNAKIASNPWLTWLNVEVDKARLKVMESMYEPVSSQDDRRNMDMLRITSSVSWPGAKLSWIDMRKHTGHSSRLHAGVPPPMNESKQNKIKLFMHVVMLF